MSWSYTAHGVTLSDPKLSLTALLLLLQVKAPNAALKEQIPGKKMVRERAENVLG